MKHLIIIYNRDNQVHVVVKETKRWNYRISHFFFEFTDGEILDIFQDDVIGIQTVDNPEGLTVEQVY